MNKIFLLFLFLVFHVFSYGQSAGEFVSYEKSGESLIIQGTKGVLKIQAITAEIFKVQLLDSKTSIAYDSSYTVSLKSSSPINQITESSTSVQLLFEKCALVINKKPLSVALKSGDEIKIKLPNVALKNPMPSFFRVRPLIFVALISLVCTGFSSTWCPCGMSLAEL